MRSLNPLGKPSAEIGELHEYPSVYCVTRAVTNCRTLKER